ncbi:MAG: GNAT family N-acetyltransferase [Chloroflexota bacterium]
MWNVRRLTEPAEILAFLERDRVYAAYAIGDLEPELFKHTEWCVAEADGQPKTLALHFTGLEPAALFLMGEAAGLPVILGSALRPRLVCASAPREHLAVLQAFYLPLQTQRVIRMVLDVAAFQPTDGEVLPLSPAYSRQLERLYVMAEGLAFSPYQVAQGVFYGVTDRDRLVSTAGTHVVSEMYGVAAVGNVFTHPAYRQRGLGARCTAAVVQELLSRRIQTVVLNVFEENQAAYRIYRRMGFREHCRYVEVVARRRSR